MIKKIIFLIASVALFIGVSSYGFAEEEEVPSVAETIGKQAEEIRLGILNGTPQFSMVGPLRREGGDRWSVNGEIFVVNDDTEVLGPLKAGQTAEVRGYLKRGEAKRARQIIVQQGDEKTGNLKDLTPHDRRANSSGLK